MGYFHFIQNKCLLLFVLTTLGCYVTDTTVSDDMKFRLEENKKEIDQEITLDKKKGLYETKTMRIQRKKLKV